ncbi:MAG: molybdopterin molybdotransferase MoeA [Bdellovibrionaceae bacterium]|jgi:molybdopterin molybdotransferase|nr:molybdopterin molybdotransferase MoeA [Pseudobdellovibrionaceae bacterium]
MLSVAEADKSIIQNIPEIGTITLGYQDVIGKVLKEPLVADRDYPPFDRVTMDGIALNFKSFNQGLRSWHVEKITRAGEAQSTLQDQNNCMEVMTGGVLPEGCDTVIRYEDVIIKDNNAQLDPQALVKQGQNIHKMAEDYKHGELLLEKDVAINAAHVAVLTSIGKAQVKVAQSPKITVLSTGDELVEVEQTPQAYQIRRSNVHTVVAALSDHGFSKVKTEHIIDDKSAIYNKLEAILKDTDVLILSGGVSMGKFDYIPEILADLKVKKVFHKIKQRPGKPMWFGVTDTKKMVFGLPGNPTSTLLSLYRYVIPALKKQQGPNIEPKKYARLTKDFSFKKELTYFLPVSLTYDEQGVTQATPIKTNGSGDFISITQAQGFIELPASTIDFKKGESFPLYLWRDL